VPESWAKSVVAVEKMMMRETTMWRMILDESGIAVLFMVSFISTLGKTVLYLPWGKERPSGESVLFYNKRKKKSLYAREIVLFNNKVVVRRLLPRRLSLGGGVEVGDFSLFGWRGIKKVSRPGWSQVGKLVV